MSDWRGERMFLLEEGRMFDLRREGCLAGGGKGV